MLDKEYISSNAVSISNNSAVAPACDFESGAKAVLQFLHDRLGFDLWMVTRANGEDWIVLQSVDHGYNVAPGTMLTWSETLCAQMVLGNGPHIAPDASLEPAYANAPIRDCVKIGAYIGQPLWGENGELFGTLCAIDPNVQPESLEQETDLIALLANLLSGLLQKGLALQKEKRLKERFELESLTDSMTQLYNRRASETAIASEEDRCRRYGQKAAVIVIDLDGLKNVNDTEGHDAGDSLISAAGKVIRETVRMSDFAARLGGDEFGILAIECQGSPTIDLLAKRLQSEFNKAGINASIGWSIRLPSGGLPVTWETADTAMYEAKRAKKVC